MKRKAFYKSKTVIFNALSGVLVTLEGYLSLLGAHFGPDTMQAIVLVVVVGNMVLRAVTHAPLGPKDEA